MATFTIASGQSESNALEFSGQLPAGIFTPAAWTAADITFRASTDGVTYVPVYLDDDTEVVVKAAASRLILFGNISQMFGVGPGVWIKLRSGTNALAVAQGADRALEVVILI